MSILNLERSEALTKSSLEQVLNTALCYKFAGYDTAVKHIIGELSLKFTNPEDFNDPFDCNEQFLDIIIERSLLDVYARDSARNYPRRTRRKLIRQAKKSYDPKKILRAEKKRFKICCFSTRVDDNKMWAHYAHHHTGIACGFELPLMNGNYALYPVHYTSELLKIDGHLEVDRVFNYWLTTKSQEWAYESEVRAVGRDLPDYIQIEAVRLKEIVFGCKVTGKQIEQVMKLIKSKGYYWVRFKQIQLSASTFELNVIELKYRQTGRMNR